MKDFGGTLATLAGYFALMSLFAVGGANSAIPEMHRFAVNVEHYLTDQQFGDTFALAQLTPGPNIVNFSVIFGSRFRGPLGGLVALVGLLGPPMILIIVIGAIYAHYGDLPALRRMLTGVAAAAAGLLMATVAKMARPLFRNKAVAGPLIAIATFAAIGVMHWPLPLVLAVILPVSIAAAWLRL